MSVFAQNLKKLRKQLQLNQEQFSELVDVPHSTIRDIEAGISGGQIATLEKISEALSRDPADLLRPETTSSPQATSVAPESRISSEEFNLMISRLEEYGKHQEDRRRLLGEVENQKETIRLQKEEIESLFKQSRKGLSEDEWNLILELRRRPAKVFRTVLKTCLSYPPNESKARSNVRRGD